MIRVGWGSIQDGVLFFQNQLLTGVVLVFQGVFIFNSGVAFKRQGDTVCNEQNLETPAFVKLINLDKYFRYHVSHTLVFHHINV